MTLKGASSKPQCQGRSKRITGESGKIAYNVESLSLSMLLILLDMELY